MENTEKNDEQEQCATESPLPPGAPERWQQHERQKRLDMFAAAALTGVCASPSYVDWTYEKASEYAWKQAEFMLATEPQGE